MLLAYILTYSAIQLCVPGWYVQWHIFWIIRVVALKQEIDYKYQYLFITHYL